MGAPSDRRLGVTLKELTAADAKERKLPAHTGVLVETVQPKGPAEAAGIKVGDVILKINGEGARSIAQVRRLVNETAITQQALVTVFRDGKTIDVPVTPAASTTQELLSPGAKKDLDDVRRKFEEFRRDLPRLRDRFREQLPRDLPRRFYFWSDPEPDPRSRPQDPFLVPRLPNPQFRWPLFESSPGASRLGIVVQELGTQLAEYFKVKDGVLVSSVTPQSPAANAGLKAGDVITGIDGKDVKAPDDLLRAIRGVPDGKEATLSVVRAGQPMTIKVKLAGGGGRGVWHV